MATHTWNHDRAAARIDKTLKDVEKVEIVEYVKDMSLENIPKNKAYRMNAVHMYVEIQNIGDILNAVGEESERCHERTLRFLNLHYRATHRVLKDCDARRVDFHNQRLHAVISKPYDSENDAEAKRIRRGVAIAQLLIDVLDQTGDDDAQIPNAKVRVGIDSGKALAVNNGRRSGREPLFLGTPANLAAKYSAGAASGIFLTANARASIGLKKVDDPKNTVLTAAEVKVCQDAAALEVTSEKIVKDWRQDLADSPIGSFKFSGHTPPLSGLDISLLSPANSRRQDLVSIYADIDGFTKYVGENIDDNPEDVVRTLHVLRSEMDCVLSADFEGRRVRFIGDCIHGLMCEGTAQTTDAPASISDATLCAGGIRSSFELAMDKLKDAGYEAGKLGLAIGFEYGPTATSRLGMQGSKVRCSVSRGVQASEEEQKLCTGKQTGIGPVAYKKANESVRKLFGDTRRTTDLDYQEAAEGLSARGDKTALAAKAEVFSAAPPAVARYSNEPIRPHAV